MTIGARFARTVLMVLPFVGGIGVQQAGASIFTVATFADPSPGSDTPLFEYNVGASNTLSGGWSGSGLTLETVIGDFPDATFTMSVVDPATLGGASGSGVIEFFDSASDPLLTINFDVSLLSAVGFGYSDFLQVDATAVSMSGPVIQIGFEMPTINLEETFTFAFSNQVATDSSGSFSATAAFASSTTEVPIPEPASLTLLACGAGLILRRRRKAVAMLPRLASAKSLAVVLGLFVIAGQAQASPFTIATFADPAADATTPLFELDNDQLSGSWSGTGLTLQTPGLGAVDYSDAVFSMAPVTVNGDNTTGPGLVEFRDSNNDLLFMIAFNSGLLTGNIAFGASDFVADGVVISGPVVPFALADEAFAFSFANLQATSDGFTATAGFTSSATPEPASLMLTTLGAAFMLKRRRK